jgi:hypothetical protein
MALTKFADQMRGVNSKIADLKAATSDLTIAEKRQLLESLTSDIQAASGVVDGPKRRLAAVQAAATSTSPRTKEAFRVATSMLKRLGTEIDAIAASGDISPLEEKIKALKWSSLQRTELKLMLGIIGAITA